MAQAEFVEMLKRLAGGWRVGMQPHSRTPTAMQQWKTRDHSAPCSPYSRRCDASACTRTGSFPRPARAINVNVGVWFHIWLRVNVHVYTRAGGNVGS